MPLNLTCTHRTLAALLVLTAGTVPADGAITYLTQERRVRAEGTVNGQNAGRLITAPNFGSFNESWTQVLGQNDAVVTASQNSQLLPEAILMGGVARATLNGTFNTVETDAVSFFKVTFTLDTAAAYRIDHSHASISNPSVGEGGSRLARAILTHQTTGTILDWRVQRAEPDTWPDSPFESVLLPGQYTLEVALQAGRNGVGFATTNESTVSFALTIPTPSTAVLVAPAGVVMLRRRRPNAAQRAR